MNLNKVTLIGNLTADPKTTRLPSGQSITTFGVATNHKWRDAATKQMKEAVEFHNIVAWRHLAEIVAKFLKKGSRVFVEGRLTNRAWQDRQGLKHSRPEIVASNLIMLGKPAAKRSTEQVEEEVTVDGVPA